MATDPSRIRAPALRARFVVKERISFRSVGVSFEVDMVQDKINLVPTTLNARRSNTQANLAGHLLQFLNKPFLFLYYHVLDAFRVRYAFIDRMSSASLLIRLVRSGCEHLFT